MKRLIFPLLISFFLITDLSYYSHAQKVTLSGIISSKENGETMFGVYIILTDSTNLQQPQGTLSNQSGFYSLSVLPGHYQLTVSYLGFKEIKRPITITQHSRLNFELEPKAIVTDEVVISAQKADHNVQTIDVGKMTMNIETIKALPALFGEVDVLKSIQLLPGVQSGGEGNSGYYVRGGNTDQNLILLDEATIYNAAHLFGFFSIFNADAVKNIEMVKSGMPAQYGGRLSSILDVYQKEGNLKRFEVDGGLGLIFSRLSIQGPIKKDKCAFIVSARRTYIDFLIQPFLKKTSPLKGTNFYFYDVNAKFNIILNNKHRLFIGAYYGKDVYGFKSSSENTLAQFNWGNAAASIRWNWIIRPKLFLNTSATFSNYDFSTEMKMDVYSFKLSSGVRDYSLKSELSYIPNPKHLLRFGLHYTFHTLFPNQYQVNAGESSQLSIPSSPPYFAHEVAFYANDEYSVSKWLKMNLGLRYTHFEHIGSFTRYILDDFGYVIDSVKYAAGEIIKQYNRVEPRISARFLLDSNTSIKASFTLNYQFLHQVSMATISLPVDVWMPSTDLIKPQTCLQYSVGIFRNFFNNLLESYIDLYYKQMFNLAEYKDGLDYSSLNINPDQMYTFGKGNSYGVELFLKKSRGRFNGFIGYTLSFTTRQFDALNNGNPFYAKYDRRHDLSINLGYEIIRNRLSASAVWIFASGNTMTIPLGYYFYGGSLITEYSDRNAYRMPPYHRLDLSLNWTIVKNKKFETGLNFSVYNVYNRKNPFFIFFETTTNMDIENQQFDMTTKAYQMSLFPILPSITWNFKF